MRILWHSAAPWVSGGYGRVCKEVVTRLQNETHHEVAVQCLTSVKKDPILWHGEVWDGEKFVKEVELDEPIPVYPSSSNAQYTHFGVKEAKGHFEDFGADFYFTHFDTWMKPARQHIPQMDIPYGSYVIVDHYPAPDAVVEQVSSSYETVAMSRYAQEALMERGVRATYIPHGVDTDKYVPIYGEGDGATVESTDAETGETRMIDLSDRFVIGMVAANYADRKNIPHHMEAFKKFLDEVDDDAIMYMHMQQNPPTGHDLYSIQQQLGIPDENMIWVPPDKYHSVGDVTLNNWYSTMDVLVNCSMGESWGLTITEAMSCETPAIVTNFSSMPEQVGVDHSIEKQMDMGKTFVQGDHGLAVNPTISWWRERVSAKQYVCDAHSIWEALLYYYSNPQKRIEHGERARQFVRNNYDWDTEVVPKFIKSFNQIEEILV